MKLIYTPRAGYESVVPGWPASDHDEPDAKTAEAKIASGFYKRAPSKRKSAGEGAGERG